MSSTYDGNTSVVIEDLTEIEKVSDSNLLIVEDEEDTKKSTVKNFKKSFIGDYDDPENFKFYSSKKVTEMLDTLERLVNDKANSSEIEKIEKRLSDILSIPAGEGKDQELVDARDGEATLSERLKRDINENDSKYLKVTPLTNYIGKGYQNELYIPGKGKVEVVKTGSAVLYMHSLNSLDLPNCYATAGGAKTPAGDYDEVNTGENYLEIVKSEEAFTFDTVGFNCGIGYRYPEPGEYIFTANIDSEGEFVNNPITLSVVYTDQTKDELEYNFEEVLYITAAKPVYAIELYVKNNDSVGSVKFSNPMLIPSWVPLNKFIPFTIKKVMDNSVVDNDSYIFYATGDGTIRLTYNDPDANTASILSDLKMLKSLVNDKKEKCGLIEEEGIYQFFDSYTSSASDASDCTIENSTREFYRNGIPSKKITISESAVSNPYIKQELDEHIDVIDTVTLIFYIDRTTFYNFNDKDGIRVHLSSDEPSIRIANYLTYIIKKSEMVQGWNCVKRRITDFKEVGSPDANNIKTITVEVGRNDSLNGLHFYLNSCVFNQKMRPTLLLSFDGFYDESIPYLYPYLNSKNIPATLFLSSRTTLTNQALDSIIKLRVVNKWDIGVYGCNPNKEQLVEDDNYRNQYVALRNSRAWLQDSVLDKPVSYSAPYGNLRPITMPILKDLGYKIAKTGADSYCSQFTEKDFCLPMFLISNETTLDEVKAKIDYAIDTNQTISLYTNNVTEYGDESSATKLMFESIIDYICEKVEEEKLQCLTFSEFYDRCVN